MGTTAKGVTPVGRASSSLSRPGTWAAKVVIDDP
jgi:hypothetical protein